jgi:hypothetical protein
MATIKVVPAIITTKPEGDTDTIKIPLHTAKRSITKPPKNFKNLIIFSLI